MNQLINERISLDKKIKEFAPGMNYWETEYCVMEGNDDVGGGNKRDLGINTALYVARIIHFDLTLANAASWQWWTALSEADYKDGLIFIENAKPDRFRSPLEASEAMKKDGIFRTSKLMWGLGNYSLFVRPGMKRIEVLRDDNAQPLETSKALMVSAYKDQSGNLVCVLVNYSKEPQEVQLQVKNSKKKMKGFRMYETSENSDLAFSGIKAGKIQIPARSIITLVSK